MPAKVILNPYANRWKALEMRPAAEAALQSAKIAYELVQTEGPRHAIDLAEAAVRQGFSPIIAAGGDGTIGEVVNGMLRACPEGPSSAPLAILPLGSANDLFDNLKLPRPLEEAAGVIAGGKARLMDACLVHTPELPWRYFANNSAIGLEPFITLIQQRMTRLRGVLRYLAATLKGVMSGPRWNMTLEWEGGSYQGPVTLVTVGNHPRTGGLFFVTPHADGFDGLLTFVYGYLPTRLQILRTLPRLMKPGKGSYVEHPAVHEIHTSWLRIRSEQTTPMHADGEIQTPATTGLEYRISPGRLPVLLP